MPGGINGGSIPPIVLLFFLMQAGGWLHLSLRVRRVLSHILKSQSIKHDEVEVRTQTRKNGRIYRSVGRVKFVNPGRPQYVRLYGRKYYRRVIQNFTRRWALMISNDTQSPSEDSISQSY